MFSSSSTSPSFSFATAVCAIWPDAIVGKGDRPADRLGQRRRHRLQRHGGHDLALGPVEMRQHDNLGALFRQFADGGRLAFDAQAVADDLAVRSSAH